MHKGWFTSVIVPAKNEEDHIKQVIQEIPSWIDLILVADDGSTDKTNEIARDALTNSGRNDFESGDKGPWSKIIKLDGEGVGNAIITSCKYIITSSNKEHSEAYNLKKSACIVMAGDGQMDPVDLSNLLDPVIAGEVRYCKGNRFADSEQIKNMPLIRRIGSNLLSVLTTLASGIYVRDPQCGYTVTELSLIEEISNDKTWRGYGYPNWILLKLGMLSINIKEVPCKCIYRTENSGIKLSSFFPIVSTMLFLGLWNRGIEWYLKGIGIPKKIWHIRVAMLISWFSIWISAILFFNPIIDTSQIISNKIVTVQILTNLMICYFLDRMEINRRLMS